MSAKVSRFQEEADSVIQRYENNKSALLVARNEHGTPYRVDSSAESNHWKFLDSFILSVKA